MPCHMLHILTEKSVTAGQQHVTLIFNPPVNN
jgi:hypothetical protein